MRNFLAANAGMESRFGFVFEFPDYSPLDLAHIFLKKLAAARFAAAADVTAEAVARALEQATSASWRQLRNGGVAVRTASFHPAGWFGLVRAAPRSPPYLTLPLTAPRRAALDPSPLSRGRNALPLHPSHPFHA